MKNNITTERAIEVLGTVLSLIDMNYIGISLDLQKSLTKSIDKLSNKSKFGSCKECEDVLSNLKKLSNALPPESFVLNKILPDDLQQALDKAIEVMKNVLELKRMSDKGDIKITRSNNEHR